MGKSEQNSNRCQNRTNSLYKKGNKKIKCKKLTNVWRIYPKSLHSWLLYMLITLSSCVNFDYCAASVLNFDEKLQTIADLNQISTFDASLLSNIKHTRRERRQTPPDAIKIAGIRVDDGAVELMDGVQHVHSNVELKIRVFGSGLSKSTVIAFTTVTSWKKGACLKPETAIFTPNDVASDGTNALFTVKFPKQTNTYFICAKNDENSDAKIASDSKALVHQGDAAWTKIAAKEPLLPLWLAIIMILLLLVLSALFSGLNLGLLSLDRTELKILHNAGTPTERKYAERIQPVRNQGNYLLCSILLGNVLVNSTITMLLETLTTGLLAVIISTLAIVLLSEIAPQAFCSRHGLAVGAKTIYITKTVMAITAPLSYPVSRVLDAILGEEIGNYYNRERLKELLRVTNDVADLDKNEMNIISGALELRKKTVGDVMTRIEDVFMLPLDAILDFETVSMIMMSGYSRVPVYDGDRQNIVSLLYIKDLAFVDTDDDTPLRTLCEFYQNPIHFVFDDYTLDVMFNMFKDGNIGHLAFVHRVNNEVEDEPFYEIVGLVTLEDVIEELIQAEIVDEFDVFIDNRTKVRLNRQKQNFTAFLDHNLQTIRVSPQLSLAALQYLSTTVDAFKKDVISTQVLRRLLNQDIYHHIKIKGKDKSDPSLFIYTKGKPVDFFMLVLEGRVEVTIGQEALMFDSGPFTYFGAQALVQNATLDTSTQMTDSTQSLNMDAKIRQTFVPDYSVRALTDVVYIVIKRILYLTARNATLLENARKPGALTNEAFNDEVDRLLHLATKDKQTRFSPTNEDIERSLKDLKISLSSRSNSSNEQNKEPAAPNDTNNSQEETTPKANDEAASEIASDPANDDDDEPTTSAKSARLPPEPDEKNNP